MVLKPPGAAQTTKTTDFQPNPKPPLLNPPLATADTKNTQVQDKILHHPRGLSQDIILSNRREMALELVSGADFLCKLMSGAGPVDLRGSRGPRGRPDPENDRFSTKSKTPLC